MHIYFVRHINHNSMVGRIVTRSGYPAFKINLPDEPYCNLYDNICGKHTWLIKGGEPKSIHPDEVYLRRLAQINNLKWEK